MLPFPPTLFLPSAARPWWGVPEGAGAWQPAETTTVIADLEI